MSNHQNNIIKQLDRVKRYSPKGGSYWTARGIQPILAYSNWQNFEGVIRKARMSCESAGIQSENHFIEASNMVSIGSDAKRSQRDYYLTRYACYLIAMNADPSKPEIGVAQTYFAAQTRRMEIQDTLLEEKRRIQLRNRIASQYKNLSGAAKAVGVERHGIFQDAGYRGLYGGMGMSEIKAYKGIPRKDKLFDRAGSAELAANAFRITQTEEKLRQEVIQGEQAAIETHKDIGEKVRFIIEKIGGTVPEDLPAMPHIKNVMKKHKRARKKIGKGNITG